MQLINEIMKDMEDIANKQSEGMEIFDIECGDEHKKYDFL